MLARLVLQYTTGEVVVNLDSIRLVTVLRDMRNRPGLTDNEKSALTTACAILMAADYFVTDVEANVRDYMAICPNNKEDRQC